jgi:multidrug resistance efflux pump
MDETVCAAGTVEGREDYILRSSVDSRVVRLNVDEGDAVKKGQVIIELDTSPLEDQIQLKRNRVKELSAELEVTRGASRILENDPLPKHYRNSAINVQEYRDKVSKSTDKLRIFRRLRKKNVISKVELDEVEEEYFSDLSKLKMALEDHKKVKNGLAGKIVRKSLDEVRLLETKLENCETHLKLLIGHLKDYMITAPADGIITFMDIKNGHYAREGETLVKMSSLKNKKVSAYVNEREIYKIKRGQFSKINSLSYNRFIFGGFSGKVVQIAELPVEINGSHFYPVEIAVTDEPYTLKLGSSAEVLIVTGRQRIISAFLGLDRRNN